VEGQSVLLWQTEKAGGCEQPAYPGLPSDRQLLEAFSPLNLLWGWSALQDLALNPKHGA